MLDSGKNLFRSHHQIMLILINNETSGLSQVISWLPPLCFIVIGRALGTKRWALFVVPLLHLIGGLILVGVGCCSNRSQWSNRSASSPFPHSRSGTGRFDRRFGDLSSVIRNCLSEPCSHFKGDALHSPSLATGCRHTGFQSHCFASALRLRRVVCSAA